MKVDISRLKDIEKKHMTEEVAKLFLELNEDRNLLLRNLIHTTNKKAFFTIDTKGKIKRKEKNHIILSILLLENNEDLFRYFGELIDFSEQDSMKEEKISRIPNIDMEKLKLNLMKVVLNGKLDQVIKYANELYKKDEKTFYEVMSNLVLMDNINSGKTLYLLSMKKYFEKYGYNLEVLYFVMSYITKMRIDLYEYENVSEEEGDLVSLEKELKSNEKYRNEEGLNLLGYLEILKDYQGENKKLFVSILKARMDNFKGSIQLSEITEEIFEKLIK